MMVRIRLAPSIIRRARPALFCCAGTMAAGLLVSPPSLSQSQPLASSHAVTQVPRLLVAPDPDRFEVRTLLDVLRAAARALYIGGLLVPSLLVLLPAYLFPSHCQAILETEMLRALERGGPCLIKLGQWASTRADILPPSLCRRLSSLHDGAPAHAFHHTEQAIESAFSAPLGRNFARLDVQPVGSGCIAQVHLGETVEGTRVAVKVLHPNVERLVATDVYLLRTAARLVEQLVPLPGIRWLALSESVDHFATFMSSQLDLRHEAANLDRFRLNFARQASDGDGAIEFPRPLHEERLVSSRVLVETFVQGESVSSLLHRAAERAPGGTAMEGLLGLGKARDAEFTRAGLIAFFKMMFRDNFVHGDLHPGNIMLAAPEGKPLRISFVDAGLAVELSERDRKNFKSFFRALGLGDGRLAAKLMMENATEQQCADPDAFQAGVERIVKGLGLGGDGSFNLGTLKIGDVLIDVTSLVRQHRVKVEPNFTTLFTSIIVLEGLGRQLDPSLDLFEFAMPMME